MSYDQRPQLQVVREIKVINRPWMIYFVPDESLAVISLIPITYEDEPKDEPQNFTSRPINELIPAAQHIWVLMVLKYFCRLLDL